MKDKALSIPKSRIKVMREICKEFRGVDLMTPYLKYQSIMEANKNRAPKPEPKSVYADCLKEFDSWCLRHNVECGM